MGEGYGTSISKTFTSDINIPSISSSADSIKIEIRMFAVEGSHEIDFKLNDQIIGSKYIENTGIFDTTITVSVGLLNTTNTILIVDNDVNTKGFSISNIKASYKRSFVYSGTFKN